MVPIPPWNPRKALNQFEKVQGIESLENFSISFHRNKKKLKNRTKTRKTLNVENLFLCLCMKYLWMAQVFVYQILPVSLKSSIVLNLQKQNTE
jgi:hypothetical protein